MELENQGPGRVLSPTSGRLGSQASAGGPISSWTWLRQPTWGQILKRHLGPSTLFRTTSLGLESVWWFTCQAQDLGSFGTFGTHWMSSWTVWWPQSRQAPCITQLYKAACSTFAVNTLKKKKQKGRDGELKSLDEVEKETPKRVYLLFQNSVISCYDRLC